MTDTSEMNDGTDSCRALRADGAGDGSRGGAGQSQRGCSGSDALQPNELAELYDLFYHFQKLVDAAAEEQGHRNGDPARDWANIIGEFLNHGHPEGAPGWGEQQSDRNDLYISEYRDVYGDGTRVTEFHYVSTTEPPAGIEEPGSDRSSERIPVAPESDTPFPVLVEDEEELADAVSLLEEFPAFPAADHAPGETALSEAESLEDLPEGRIDRLEITVQSVDDDPGSKRDAAFDVETQFGEEAGLDFWTTHEVGFSLEEGDSYVLEEITLQAWDTEEGREYQLSSTRDLIISATGTGQLSASDSKAPSSSSSSSASSESTTGQEESAQGDDPGGEDPGSDRVGTLMKDFDWDQDS